MTGKTIVLGASPNPERYSHVAANMLQGGSFDFELYGRKKGTVAGKEIDLTPSEYDLLLLLMSAPGRAISRIELLEHLQGTALEGAEKTVNVHIRNLRTKIEPDPSNPRYIETVFGVGYRFCTA